MTGWGPGEDPMGLCRGFHCRALGEPRAAGICFPPTLSSDHSPLRCRINQHQDQRHLLKSSQAVLRAGVGGAAHLLARGRAQSYVVPAYGTGCGQH